MEQSALACSLCPYLLRKANSCPSYHTDLLLMLLQLLYVAISVLPYFVLLGLLTFSFSIRKNPSSSL